MTRLLSLVIAAVLVLQTAASFDIFPKLFSRPSYVLWPFMNYPMYRTAHYEGTVIARFHVLGQTAERVEVELTPEDFGLNFRKFQDIAIPAIRRRDVAQVAMFAEIYREKSGNRLVGIRVEQHGDILTRDGLRPAPPAELATVSLR
jgi:hypothetical protein